MELSMLTEQIIAYMLGIVGLSVLVQTSMWVQVLNWVGQIQQQNYILLATFSGMIFTPLALLIIMTHNIWEWSPSVIVTVLGWAMLLKSVSALFFPKQGQSMALFLQKKGTGFLKMFFRAFGLLYILLALVVLYY